MQWIEFLRATGKLNAALEFSHEGQIMTDIGERFWVIRVEGKSQLRFCLELLILAAEKMHDRKPASGIGVARIELRGAERVIQGAADRVGAGVHLETVLGEINVGEKGMRVRGKRIEQNGSFEQVPSLRMHLGA